MSSVTTADTAGIDGRSRIAAALAKRMRGRRRAEVRFQVYGIAAIVLSVTMLAILLVALMSWYLDHVGRAIQPFLAG